MSAEAPAASQKSAAVLPRGARPPFRVWLNSVEQEEGRDYQVAGSKLIFDRPLAKEGRLGIWNWTMLLLGVRGTYRKNVSAAVEDLDLTRLPDRALALDHGPGRDRVGGGRDRAGGAHGGVRSGCAWDGHREARLHAGCIRRAAIEVRVVLVRDLERRVELQGACLVGEVRLVAHVGDDVLARVRIGRAG
jgi:hypothetical protein